MKIEINDAEIKLAIIDYVNNQGISISDKDVDVHMIAGRKDAGFSAHVSINEIKSTEKETVLEPVVDAIEPLDTDNLFVQES